MKKIMGILLVVTIFLFSGCSLNLNSTKIKNVNVLEKDKSGQFVFFHSISDDKQIKKIFDTIQNSEFVEENTIELDPQYQFYVEYASDEISEKVVTYTLQKLNKKPIIIIGMADTNKIIK